MFKIELILITLLMFPKNQNLYLIIYIMFVSQVLRNLPRQKTASVPVRKNINMYVTPEK
jgi:hypothetical protein